MRRPRLRLAVPLAATSIVVGASAAFGALSDNFTNPTAPVPGHGAFAYLTMKGATTGTFTGGVTVSGHAGEIEVLALDFGLTTPVDAATGQSSGPTACDGVSFRKPTDRSTPLLVSAETSGEAITSAVFDEVGSGGAAGIAQNVFTVTLTNATITSVHHVDATTTGAYEDVTLTAPETVTVTWNQGGITSTFNCKTATVG
jgi:type VI secretion system Hcp family effector